VSGAKLISAYEFSPSEVITDSNGDFEFTIKTNFLLTEGSEIGKSDNGGQWSFYVGCYDYATISAHKNYEGHELDLGLHVFDEEVSRKEIFGETVADIGDLEIHPSADIFIVSDIETSFNVQYKYKNREGYNGPGQGGYDTEHYLSTALPLDYDAFIQFGDEQGNQYQSSTYRIPLDARCGVITLKYFDGESEWFFLSEIQPDEETGPIDIPEEVEDQPEEILTGICSGCLKDKKCYPFGYRKDGKYCTDESNFIDYKDSEVSCDNNFECESNLCIDDECVSAGFFRRIMNWFKRLFG